MTKYLDSSGLEWELKLTVGRLETLTEHGIDIENLLSDPNKLATLFLTNPKKICEMLYVMLESQIKARNLTPADFANSIDRETLDVATNSMITEIVCFFQKGATTVAQEKVPLLLQQMEEKIQQAMRIRLDAVSGSLDTVMKSVEFSASPPMG